MEINFSVLSHPFTRRWLILGGRKAINFEDACSMATFEVVLFQNPILDLCPLRLELLAFARTGGDFSKTPKLELKMLEMLAFSFGFGCREGGGKANHASVPSWHVSIRAVRKIAVFWVVLN